MVNLWALSQAFRSRSPLPQFLPSPRHALDSLEHTLDDLARKARSPNELDSQGSPADISILYGMAENAALGEVCNVLEEVRCARMRELNCAPFCPSRFLTSLWSSLTMTTAQLTAAARTLFGSKTFMHVE